MIERMVSRGGSGVSNLSRRLVIAGLGAACVPLPARAADDFTIDWQGGERTPEVAASLAAQIALVRSLKVSEEAMAFFRAQVITVDRELGTATRAGPRGVFFERRPMPAENPVLLHELIHRWQLLRMADGARNAEVRGFYEAAKASGLYPAESYMLKNPFEFFAMTASVVLWGKAARPPGTRGNVLAKSPELHAFIVRTFGLRLT